MSPQGAIGNVVTEQQLRPFFQTMNEKADRITTGFMVGFFLGGIALSFFYHTGPGHRKPRR